jgi:hypothetical protein
MADKPNTLPPQHCGVCRFFLANAEVAIPGLEQGLCRRFPAQVIVGFDGPRGFFPPMMAGGWCGEFKIAPRGV